MFQMKISYKADKPSKGIFTVFTIITTNIVAP